MGKDTKIGLLVGVLVVVLFALVFFGGGSGSEDRDGTEAVTPQTALATHDLDRGRAPAALPDADAAARRSPVTDRAEGDARAGRDAGDGSPGAERRPLPVAALRRAPDPLDRGAAESLRDTTPPGPLAARRDTDLFREAGRSADAEMATAPPAAAQVYEVKPGDNYYNIAKAQYGKASLWPALKAANENKDLFPGMKIVIPPAPTERGAAPAAQGRTSTPLGPDEYEVVADDNLWKIAARHFGNGAKYMLIFEANRNVLTSPDQPLRVGMRLRLPPKTAAAATGAGTERPSAPGARTASAGSVAPTARRPDTSTERTTGRRRDID